MVRGYGRKEKVAQLVDKSTGVVDKRVNACLTISAPFRTNALKRLRWQALWGDLRYKSAKEVRNLPIAYCAYRRWLSKDRERVFSNVIKFLSIYWLRV